MLAPEKGAQMSIWKYLLNEYTTLTLSKKLPH